jgi:arylsulfatase A-like enzyme/tetratricopeptide (TPR) repeat protein
MACTACSRPDIRNVLLVSIDTCRADHLGCYGDRRGATPNLDRLAASGVVFESTVSPCPVTLPAHASLMTGLNPPAHGVHDNDYRLGQHPITLAERLKEAGFSTGAVVGAFVLDSTFGLDQGFDDYQDLFAPDPGGRTVTQRRAGEVSRHALAWLEEHRSHPFFLFVHYYDPHMLYDPQEPFRSKYPDDPYLAEIATVDQAVGELLDRLDALGLSESTLVVITADHGEMLGEHGERTHSYFVYESALRVPLIFRMPGRLAPRRLGPRVGLVDVAPTIYGLLGIESPPGLQGVDLSASMLQGEAPASDRPYYCEAREATKYGCNPLLGVHRGRWKYVHTTRPELYDLETDPLEAADLHGEKPAEVAELAGLLGGFLQQTGSAADDRTRADLDPDALSRLRALGYVSGDGAAPEGAVVDPGRPDPKDLIEYHTARMGISFLVEQGQLAEASRLAEQMLRLRPDLALGHVALAEIALKQGDHRRALTRLERAVELEPDRVEALGRLGTTLAALGRFDDAAARLRRAVELRPGDAELHNDLGVVLARLDDARGAAEQYEQAVALRPDHVEAHNNLANLLVREGRWTDAVARYVRAAELRPFSPEIQRNLGSALARTGRIDEALAALRRSVELQPGSLEARLLLGNTLRQAGRIDDAAQEFRRVLEAGSGKEGAPVAEAHFHLASIHLAQGRVDEALAGFAEATRLRADWAAPWIVLARIRASYPEEAVRDPAEAVGFAEQAVRLTAGADPSALAALGIAQASAGRFDQAVATSRAALDRARATGRTQLVEQVQARIEEFEAGRKFLDESLRPAAPAPG